MKKYLKDPLLSESEVFNDPWLLCHASEIRQRRQAALYLERNLIAAGGGDMVRFCNYHEVFGLHWTGKSWLFREWAPNAEAVYILCDRNDWYQNEAFRLVSNDDETFERQFAPDTFKHEDFYRLLVKWPGGQGDRIPTAARRVVQDPDSLVFNAQVWQPDSPYQWKTPAVTHRDQVLLIYEAHVGMSIEDCRIGTFKEFERDILPRIKHTGYNCIQLMAVQEHPYYGSVGYHVSSFFAPSSRFGTPDDLKSLIDSAHAMGIRVIMDIIHSHAVSNEVEGLSRFDGTLYQFFHDGHRGKHTQWDSRCFDYGKRQVVRFLLSNLRYWLEEFRIDGFRFDGITSMMLMDHGLTWSLTSYDDYYSSNVDVDALSYLYVANRLVHSLNPAAITIAEDVSGYPGLAASAEIGGTGFDYRFAMGIPDHWIKLLKDQRDEDWHMETLWHELTARRSEEKTISYAESHDQALVGDKTLIMHMMGGLIYTGMHKRDNSIETFRAISLHKMIRLITLGTANAGYLTFMGNEFGHPEWVDFPSQRNQWSLYYARRQWSLQDNVNLYYNSLGKFDRAMVAFARENRLFDSPELFLLCLHQADKVIAFSRKNFVFAFNFNPSKSFVDYSFDAPSGKYEMVLNTDELDFGGKQRLEKNQQHFTLHYPSPSSSHNMLSLYLPARTAIVLKKTAEVKDTC